MHMVFFVTLINEMMNKNLIYVYFYACSSMSLVGLINCDYNPTNKIWYCTIYLCSIQ